MTFTLLPGLPATGASPVQFTYGNRRTHSEGTAVEFQSDSGPWVGNFQLGIGTLSGAFLHPDRHCVVVVAGGQGYIVDPKNRVLTATFGGGINGVSDALDGTILVFDDAGIRFSALGPEGWRWHTKRLSWDGFENVVVGPQRLCGSAWNAVEQRWEPFSVFLADGSTTGGAYNQVPDQVI